MIKYLRKFERAVIGALSLMLALVVFLSLVELGRKIITMDPKAYEALTLVGIAAIILALFAGYWIIKKSNRDTSCKSNLSKE